MNLQGKNVLSISQHTAQLTRCGGGFKKMNLQGKNVLSISQHTAQLIRCGGGFEKMNLPGQERPFDISARCTADTMHWFELHKKSILINH